VDWEKPIVISRRMVEFQTLPGRHLVDPSSGGVVPLDFPALKIHAGAYGSGSYGNVGYYKATSPRGGRVNAGAYWHPHVHFETGEACLQDFATLILRAASAEDFLTVMSLVGDHLGSYNPLSPYTYLHDFVGRSQDPWHTPYCPSCKLSRVNCGCPKQAYQPSCVFCLAPMTPDNTSACGWCVSCCESHHRYSLVSANAHSGYNGTGCTTK
jgi:hypothetical protein